MSAVLLIGLGAGLALTFLMSQIRPVFNDRATLQEVTSLPILGTVSMKWTDTEVRRQRRGLLALGVSIASLFASFGTIVAVMSVLGRA